MIWTIVQGVFSWLVGRIFGKSAPDVALEERAAGEALGRSETTADNSQKVLDNVAKAQSAASDVNNGIANGVPITESDGFRRD